jgi:hypothetical protein
MVKPKRLRGPTKVKQSEIERTIRAMKAAELPLRGIEVDATKGTFTVLVGEPGKEGNELDKWLGKKGALT